MVLKILSMPIRYGARMISYFSSLWNMLLILHYDPDSKQIFDAIRSVRKEGEMLLGYIAAYQIYTVVKKVKKVEGAIAEVGVYKGGSAHLICEAGKQKAIHLFDTFEGLPSLSIPDNQKQFQPGDYSASFEEVKKRLKNYENVYFHKGLFPLTASSLTNEIFSFVHLDVDIYQSTLDCLNFFYTKINRGGIIISHDYPSSRGVKKAFDVFFKDKLETIVELPGCNQCLIVKV